MDGEDDGGEGEGARGATEGFRGMIDRIARMNERGGDEGMIYGLIERTCGRDFYVGRRRSL